MVDNCDLYGRFNMIHSWKSKFYKFLEVNLQFKILKHKILEF